MLIFGILTYVRGLATIGGGAGGWGRGGSCPPPPPFADKGERYQMPHPFHRFSGMMPASVVKFFDKSFRVNKHNAVVTATLSPVHSAATQLNSTQLDVELS